MARLLGVSRSDYYAWALRPERDGDPWARLRAEVARLQRGFERRFGARSILWSLLEGTPGTTLCSVRKLMREMDIQGVRPRSSRLTTVPDPGAPSHPDLLRRGFESAAPTTRLIGDITYLRTGEEWLCLAVVINLATRMVVDCQRGWAPASSWTRSGPPRDAASWWGHRLPLRPR